MPRGFDETTHILIEKEVTLLFMSLDGCVVLTFKRELFFLWVENWLD